MSAPLIKSRWGASCATCDQPLISSKRTWPIECDACNQRIHSDTVSANNHAPCAKQVLDWLIDKDVTLDPEATATVCGPCARDIDFTIRSMAQHRIFVKLTAAYQAQGLAFDPQDVAHDMAVKAQDAYSAWLYTQPVQTHSRLGGHVFGQYHVDTSNFVKAIGRVLDVVHSTGPKLNWSIKLGTYDETPQTNLAAKIITLPNYFQSYHAVGASHEQILDTLVGTALHEAGHAAYDQAQTIIKLGNSADASKGETQWALQMALNIVCDYNLERKVIARYPNFKGYFDTAAQWSVQTALPNLIDTLGNDETAEDRVDVRLMVVCWAVMCPGELTKAGALISDKLVWIVNKCFQILKYAYGKGLLQNEVGKIATARGIYELIRTVTPAGYQPKIGANSKGTGQPQPGGEGNDGSTPEDPSGADGEGAGADGPESGSHSGGHAGGGAQPGAGPDLSDHPTPTTPGTAPGLRPATGPSVSPGDPDQSPDAEDVAEDAPAPLPTHNLGPDVLKAPGEGGISGMGTPATPAEAPTFDDPWVGESDLSDRKEGRKTITPFDDIKSPDAEDRIDETTEQSSELRYAGSDSDKQFDPTHRRESESQDGAQKPLIAKETTLPYWLNDSFASRQKRVGPVVGELKRILRIRNADRGGKNTGRRSGLLTRRHVARLSTLNQPNVFHTPLPDGAPSVRFALLIDESSSMHWGAYMRGMLPSEAAKDAATALAEALTGIRGVKLWVWGFSMDKNTNRLAMEFENPEDTNTGLTALGRKGGPSNQPMLRPYFTPQAKRDLKQIELPTMSGGTPTGEAMNYAAEQLLKGALPEEQKIVLVLTDGEAGGWMSTDIPIRKYWGRVDFVHIGIGGVQDPHFAHYVGPIADVTELPAKLAGIAKEVLV